MNVKKIIQDFYHHFEKKDLDGLIALFAPHARVESPTLGKMEAQPFYRELFSKTKHFKTTMKDIFINPDNPHRAATFLSASWETKNGDVLAFESVVIFEMNDQGKIQMIHIIYDAQRAREALRKVS
ncbi:MAG TPA: nuclear transport factor 2 family protein [Rhabdochlamydiaceae bacterium]|jgi:ketosteroid isomerase-like protein